MKLISKLCSHTRYVRPKRELIVLTSDASGNICRVPAPIPPRVDFMTYNYDILQRDGVRPESIGRGINTSVSGTNLSKMVNFQPIVDKVADILDKSMVAPAEPAPAPAPAPAPTE